MVPSRFLAQPPAVFSQSDMCRLGVTALLRDIINGELLNHCHSPLMVTLTCNTMTVRPYTAAAIYSTQYVHIAHLHLATCSDRLANSGIPR